MFLKPSNGIFRRKNRKWASEFFFTSRVKFYKLSYIKTMVSDLTTSSSWNANLRHNLFTSFENGNLYFWIVFCYVNRCKNTGSSSTNNKSIVCFHNYKHKK